MLLVVREGELPRILKINLNQRKHHSNDGDNDDKGHKPQISYVDLFFGMPVSRFVRHWSLLCPARGALSL
jgi:hypothetical protein